MAVFIIYLSSGAVWDLLLSHPSLGLVSAIIYSGPKMENKVIHDHSKRYFCKIMWMVLS